jgi:hypothetical protein
MINARQFRILAHDPPDRFLAAQVAVDRFDFSVPAPVRPTTAPHRTARCPQMSGCPLRLLRHWLCNVCRHTPEHPCGTPRRTAHRNESRAIPSLLRVTPSATSERLLGLLGSSPIPLSFVASYFRLQLRPLPSTGITRLHRYYKPLRHPKRPGLSLASFQLIQPQSPLGLPVLPSVPFAYMPSPLPRQVRGSCSLILFPLIGLPQVRGGSAPAS